MKTLLVGLLALTTLGGAAAALAPASLSAFGADPTCTDVAGQATVCQEIVADPSAVVVDVDVDVHPTPPAVAADAAAAPTCQDLAGHGYACAEADPTTGTVFVDVQVTA